MKRRSATMLGLAVTERAILCAQVTTAGTGRTVGRLGVLTLGDGDAFEAPVALGAKLAAFLKAHGFTATRAVVGVPARWLIAQEKDVPPAGVEEAKAIVRLHAERMGSSEKGALAVDAAGKIGSAEGETVLVVAMLQRRLDQVRAFAEAAGLTLSGVTSTALAVSQFVQPTSHALVMVGERRAELVVRRGNVPRVLRHLGVSGGGAKAMSTAALAPELRRSLMSISGGDEPLIVCDTVGDDCVALEQQLGVVAQRPTLEAFGATVSAESLNGAAAGLRAASFIPGVALAAAGLDGALPVDYTRSRLTAAPVRRFGRRAIFGATLGIAIIGGLIAFYAAVTQTEDEAAALTQQLDERKPSIAAAETLIDRVAYGRTYFETRTPVLDCLGELSRVFNYDETIFSTSFAISSANVGELKGKAAEERLVLALLDRMKAAKSFSQVQLNDMRETGQRSREFSFSITFRYTPVAPITPTEATR